MQYANDCKLSSFLGIDLLLLEKALRVYTIERNEIADMVKKKTSILIPNIHVSEFSQ